MAETNFRFDVGEIVVIKHIVKTGRIKARAEHEDATQPIYLIQGSNGQTLKSPSGEAWFSESYLISTRG